MIRDCRLDSQSWRYGTCSQCLTPGTSYRGWSWQRPLQKTAVRKYYDAILLLKGLSGVPGATAPVGFSIGLKDSGIGRFSEVADDREEEEQEEDDEDNSDSEEDPDQDEPNAQWYHHSTVTKLQVQCYVNMAICFGKQEKWDSCKRNAERCVGHARPT